VPAGKYWVSATSFGCPSTLRWCNNIDNPILDITKSPWITWKKGTNFSDPLKLCVGVDFQRTAPHTTFFKTDCKERYLATSENTGPNEGDFWEKLAQS